VRWSRRVCKLLNSNCDPTPDSRTSVIALCFKFLGTSVGVRRRAGVGRRLRRRHRALCSRDAAQSPRSLDVQLPQRDGARPFLRAAFGGGFGLDAPRSAGATDPPGRSSLVGQHLCSSGTTGRSPYDASTLAGGNSEALARAISADDNRFGHCPGRKWPNGIAF
jgi:hypothetical protein